MIRRIALAATAAVALILSPAVAMAQTTPSQTGAVSAIAVPQVVAAFTCTVSDTTPAAGDPIKIVCSGGLKNERISLKVDGATSQTKRLDSKGRGTFTAKITVVGTHTLTMTNPAGTVLFTQTINVHPKYPASAYTFTTSDATPASGVAFQVNMTGGPADTAIILTVTSKVTATSSSGMTIAGTKSLSTMRNANSEAAWTVSLTEAGTYTLVDTNTAGVVRGTQTVTVAAAAPAGGGGPSRLGFTGFEGMPLAIGGGVLVLAGAGAVLVARRRKSAQVPA